MFLPLLLDKKDDFLPLLLDFSLLCFGYEAGHEAVGDGGTDPYLNQQILGVFVDRFEIMAISKILAFFFKFCKTI